ncbi:histone H1.8 isoform X1 [Bubalus kerabau]|uniref:histone H1.8 isoform X1 n=1 Tax=Bubalus carabanensis TaxID=3119969 RepID=UPI00244EBB51|nr:histone H1.8 isoform X1 [Bubalus carabanensis]
MAPGSVASSDPSSSTSSVSSASSASAEGSSRLSGSEKPGLARGAVRAPRRHPPVLRMVLEALQAGERRRGTSVAAIKVYILQKYPTVDALRLNHLLKQALATGLHRGLLIRPVNSKAKGATGSFKLVPKDKRKIPPRKTAPRMPGQAEGKDPKKPSESKKDPANPGEVKKGSRKPREGRAAPSKPGAAKKAPKKGTQTKDPEPRLGEAKKSSRRPDKAAQAPPGASGPGGKSKVKERGSRQADTKAHRKTQLGGQSSKSTVTKGENGASLAKKKMGGKVPKEAAGEGPKAKAPVPPKGSGSKKEPAPLAGKAEASKGPRKPGISTKSSVSKAASKKAEAEG